MEHTIVETPMSDEQESGLGRKADGGVGRRASVRGNHTLVISSDHVSADVGEFWRVQPPDFVPQNLPNPLPSLTSPSGRTTEFVRAVFGNPDTDCAPTIELKTADTDDGEPEKIVVLASELRRERVQQGGDGFSIRGTELVVLLQYPLMRSP